MFIRSGAYDFIPFFLLSKLNCPAVFISLIFLTIKALFFKIL
jgi:uncharacterized membrane protein YhdT